MKLSRKTLQALAVAGTLGAVATSCWKVNESADPQAEALTDEEAEAVAAMAPPTAFQRFQETAFDLLDPWITLGIRIGLLPKPKPFPCGICGQG